MASGRETEKGRGEVTAARAQARARAAAGGEARDDTGEPLLLMSAYVWEPGRGCPLCVLAHPARPLVYVGSSNGDLRAWDAEAGECRLRFGEAARAEHEGSVRALALDPAGARLVSGSGDGTARIWDAATGAPLRVLRQPERGSVIAVAWDALGRRIATATESGELRFWAAEPAAEAPERFGIAPPCARAPPREDAPGQSPDRGLRALAAHPLAEADMLAAGGDDGAVRLWRFSDGAFLGAIDAHGDAPVTALAGSRALLLSASTDRTVRVWPWAPGAAALRTLDGFSNYPDRGSLAWRGARLAVRCCDGMLHLWRTRGDPAHWAHVATRRRPGWRFGVALLADGRPVVSRGGGVLVAGRAVRRRARRAAARL